MFQSFPSWLKRVEIDLEYLSMSLARMPSMRFGGAGGRTWGVGGSRGAPAPPLSCLYSRCRESWGGGGVGGWGGWRTCCPSLKVQVSMQHVWNLTQACAEKVPSNCIQIINRDMSIYYEITETLLKISVKEALELVVSTNFGMLSRSVTISHVLRSNILSPLPHLSPNIDGNVVRSLSSEAQK